MVDLMAERPVTEHMRNIQRHMPAGCWCGHGDISNNVGTESADGAHFLMNHGHSLDCQPECPGLHSHIHCKPCAAQIPDNRCCI